MATIVQNSWVAGEVNPNLIDAQTNKYYKASALNIEDMYISKSQTLKRIPSTISFTGVDNFSLDSAGNKQKYDILDSYSYLGVSYLMGAYIDSSNNINVDISVINNTNYSVNVKNTLTLSLPVETTILDYVFFNNNLVITLDSYNPVFIDYVNLTINAFVFINPPTVNTTLFDYSDYTFNVATGKDGSQAVITIAGTDVQTNITDLFLGGLFESIGTSTSEFLGMGRIVAVGLDGSDVQLTVNVIYSFTDGTYTGDGVVLQQPLFYTYNDGTTTSYEYPKYTAFYQNRLYFANTPSEPMLIAGSKISVVNDFDVGKGYAAEAVVFILNDGVASGIKHIIGQIGVIVLTDANEYAITGSVTDGITPSSFSSQVLSNWGSNDVKPVIFNTNVAFINRSSRKIIFISVPSINNYSVAEATMGMDISSDITSLSAVDDSTIDNKMLMFKQKDNTKMEALFYSVMTGKVSLNLLEYDSSTNIKTIIFESKTFLINVNDNLEVNGIFYFNLSDDFRYNILSVTSGTVLTSDSFDRWLYNPTTTNYLFVAKDTSITIPTGYTSVGYAIPLYVKSMPLSLQATDIYNYNKVTSIYVSYKDSAKFTVNNTQVAKTVAQLIATQVIKRTNRDKIGLFNNNDDKYIEVSSNNPYNIEILSYAWNISTSNIV